MYVDKWLEITTILTHTLNKTRLDLELLLHYNNNICNCYSIERNVTRRRLWHSIFRRFPQQTRGVAPI